MSKRERQTAFLKALVVHSTAEDQQHLPQRIAQAERDERCSRHAFRLMLIFVALAVFGQFYLTLLAPDTMGRPSHLVSRLLSAMLVASGISGAAFLACWFWHRALLDRVHEESRRFILSSTGFPSPAANSKSPVATVTAPKSEKHVSEDTIPLSREQTYLDLFLFRRQS